jgi:hypothetical protein
MNTYEILLRESDQQTYARHQIRVMVFSAKVQTSLVFSALGCASLNKSDRALEIFGTKVLRGWRIPLLNISAQIS